MKQNTNSQKVVGEARIPLEEWLRMRNAQADAQEYKEKTEIALKHVQTLLSYLLRSDEEVGRKLVQAIQTFNNQSHAAVFRVEEGKVYVELKEDEPS